MRNLYVGALCCALAASAAAVERLDTVLVSADRLDPMDPGDAQQTVVIDRDTIAASGAASLAELLRGRAGIQVRDTYGDGSNAVIDMRGFGATAGSNTLIVVDGRRLNPASDSANPYLGSIGLDDIERVEILPGSAGVRYGNQAVGGVVNIVTRRPGTPTAEVQLDLGSFDRRVATARLSGRQGGGWGGQVNARRERTDNYRRHNTAQREIFDLLLDRTRATGRVFLTVSAFDERLDTPGALFLDEAETDPRASAAVYANDYLNTRTRTVRAGFDQQLSEGWRLAADLSHGEEQRNFVQSFRLWPGSPASQDRRTRAFAPHLSGDLGWVDLTLGLDLQNTDYELLTSFGPQTVDQTLQAAYLQTQWPVAAGWTLDAGLRHARVRNDIDDAEDLDDAVTVGSVGLTYAPDTAWRLHARIDQNYRFAKVDEHTNVVFGQPVGLKNQRGTTYELGAEFDDGTTTGRVTVYQLNLQDEISFDASGFVNINLDRTRRRGLGLGVSRALGRAWRAGLDYDFVDSEIIAGPNRGNRVPLVPEHRVRLFAEWTPDRATVVNLEGILVSDQPYGSDFANRFPTLDGYTVVNLAARRRHGPWTFGLRLNNLFDERYSETGDIGSDLPNSGHADCIGDAFSDSCPGINPAPERNLQVYAGYRYGS